MRNISEKNIETAVIEFLTGFSFFKGLTSEEIGIISDHINFHEMDPGEILFNEGDDSKAVFFIIEGEMEVLKESSGSNMTGTSQAVINTLSKGRSIGEMSVIDNTPRSATVRAITHITLASMDIKGFRFILEKQPEIGSKILIGIARLLSVNLRRTSSKLTRYILPLS